MKSARKTKIVFSVKERRPGCVLLQAAMGGTVPKFGQLFPHETWLTAPTDDMASYEVTDDQLQQLSMMARKSVGI